MGLLKVQQSLNWLALIAHGGTEIQLLCRTKVQSVKVKEFKYREEKRKQRSSPGGWEDSGTHEQGLGLKLNISDLKVSGSQTKHACNVFKWFGFPNVLL